MMDQFHLSLDLLWTGSLVAVPLALFVAMVCRLGVRRPATRHALWLIVLASFLMPSVAVLVGVPRLADPIAWLQSGARDEPLLDEPGKDGAAPIDEQPLDTSSPGADRLNPPGAPGELPLRATVGDIGDASEEADSEVGTTSASIDARATLGLLLRTPPRPGTSLPFSNSTSPQALLLRDPPRAGLTTERVLGVVRSKPEAGRVLGAGLGDRFAWDQITARSPATSQRPVSETARTHGRTAIPRSTGAGQSQPSQGRRSGTGSRSVAGRRSSVVPVLPAPAPIRSNWEGPAGSFDSPVETIASPSVPADSASVGNQTAVSGRATSERPTIGRDTRDRGVLEWKSWLGSLVAVRDAIAKVSAPPVMFWLGGIGLFALVWVLRLRAHRRVMSGATPAPYAVCRAVEEAAELVGLRKAPRTYLVRSRISPMISCGRQARLILPQQLWYEELDDASRRAVLVHELAHLKRRDHWVCWFEVIISAIFWWHPVAWWTRLHLREEADHCCDAWVTMLLPSSRRAYAEALIRTKSYISAVPGHRAPVVGLGMATARNRRFSRRLQMVMTNHVGPRVSIVGGLLAVSIAAAGMFVMPALACPPDAKYKDFAGVTASGDFAVSVTGVVSSSAVSTMQPEKKRGRGGSSGLGVSWTTSSTGDTTAPFVVGESSTFERYMNQRSAATQPENKAAADRLRSLEKRLQSLERDLEKMLKDSARRSLQTIPNTQLLDLATGQLRGLVDGRGRGSIGGVVRPARPKCAPRRGFSVRGAGRGGGVVLAVPPQERVVVRAPSLTLLSVPTLADSDQDIARIYVLPKGKLKKLTDLMVREDVPILVSPGDGGLTVYATRAEHRVFYSFAVMISPGDVKVLDEDGKEIKADQMLGYWGGLFGPTAGYVLSRGNANADALTSFNTAINDNVIQKLGQLKNLLPTEGKTAVSGQLQNFYKQQQGLVRDLQRRQEAASLKATVRAFEAQIRQYERQAENLMRQVEAIVRQAEMLERRADQIEDRADSMRDRAQELLEQSTEDDIEDRAREELLHQASTVEAAAMAYFLQVDQLEVQAGSLEANADALRYEADAIRGMADSVGQQIDEVESQGDAIADYRQPAVPEDGCEPDEDAQEAGEEAEVEPVEPCDQEGDGSA